MDSRYSQCPHCRTIFRVTEAQLAAAGGKVRCGQCREVFDARAHFTELAQSPAPAAVPPRPPRPSAPAPSFDPSLDLGGDPEPQAAPRMDATIITGPQVGETKAKRPMPAFRPTPMMYGIGSGVLVLALLLQLSIAFREPLAETGMRGWVKAVCAVFGCEVPLRRDLEALVLSEREVRSHPRAPRALMIGGTLENRAPFPQPYPLLEVTLSSATGAVVATRRFQPAEYLADHRETRHGLPPRAAAPIRLEVADPGKDAVSFQFEFL